MEATQATPPTTHRNETADARIDTLRCDLFDMQFTFRRDLNAPEGWTETHRAVVPDTGLAAEYRKFTENPAPFFA